jgi:hypothetical protein
MEVWGDYRGSKHTFKFEVSWMIMMNAH